MELISLTALLDARERRSAQQRALLHRFGQPLICFTMNIAGPEKCSPLIEKGFQLGSRLLRDQLTALRIPLLHTQEQLLPTGPEGYYVAAASPDALKALTTALEDSLPVGRLFDMDVLHSDGQKVSRSSPRTCLLCNRPAAICGRSRAHALPELQACTKELLLQAVRQQQARLLASLATRALLFEVCVTPKPGLVDCNNSGSHADMDRFTFMASAAALSPYFEDFARIGMETAVLSPAEAFSRLRLHGREAEGAMLRATGGVNTHKGAIFTLGLLCAAAGRSNSREPAHLAATVAALTQGLTARECACARHGVAGARAEVEAGLPSVLGTGLPVLRRRLSEGLSLNDAAVCALLALLQVAQDTNIISRSNAETLAALQEELLPLLQAMPDRQTLLHLDQRFISLGLSPGGSADLLAATLFLHLLSETTDE